MPLFFRHFSKLGRSFPTELPFSPPSSIHPCPLPFARDRFYSYPSKMTKGWVDQHRIFRFSAERNAFIGTSTGYKVYFRRPSRNSRLKADFLTPNIQTTRETNFPYRGWGNSVEDRSEHTPPRFLHFPRLWRVLSIVFIRTSKRLDSIGPDPGASSFSPRSNLNRLAGFFKPEWKFNVARKGDFI